jgi:hypothetical protein
MKEYREVELFRVFDDESLLKILEDAKKNAEVLRLPFDAGNAWLRVDGPEYDGDEFVIVVLLRVPYTEQELQARRDEEQRQRESVSRSQERDERATLARLLQKYPQR